MFYEVIPTEIFRRGDGVLTYHANFPVESGQIVQIPLGKKSVTGIVLRKVTSVNFPTKPISQILYPTPLPNHLLKSALWLSKYYLSPLANCANLLTPNLKKPLKASKSPYTANYPQIELIELTKNQQKALKSLSEGPGATRLLRGVTGSGKTNIYLKMASTALTDGKSVVLLVPEIALTSQLVQIFEKTFGDCVTMVHSNQTPKQRREGWQKIINNPSPQIIIGPRSALFAPLNNLGLIIIDEAHESAYYQENSPRYSAVRLASFMAQTLKIPCILGTATPNITDYYLAKKHDSLTELTVKAKAESLQGSTALQTNPAANQKSQKSATFTPQITLIDLKNRENFTKNRYFCDQLLNQITKNLSEKHQTLIFHNRRGSAPMTLCEQCGWQALCPNCYLPMTLHDDGFHLVCHLCGHDEKVPLSCPSCKMPGVIHKGFGTKLLENELHKLFPNAKIRRFDGDNRKNETLAEVYQEVKNGEIDILIGTQTLARGLDLPHLTTVGVVQADAGLALPDFSAEERNFALLTQVLGRVGRGHTDFANAFLQTYQPNHPAIQAAIKNDYPTFAEYLLKERKKQQMPPFTYLARLAITYKTEKTTLAKIRAAHTQLVKNSALMVSPPLPAFHERTARGFTWQITLKSTSRAALVEALLPFSEFHIEIDPPSLL